MTADPSGGTMPTGTRAASGREVDADRARRILSVIGELPPLPRGAARVFELVGRADTSVRNLEEAISSDQALTARIVTMANSAFYSFDQKISTLSHAIVILGFRGVQSMALASSSRSLYVERGSRFGLQERLLWEHSLGCAAACRQVSRVVGFEREETAFATGLLHDIGKTVLNQAVPVKYARVVETVYSDRRSFTDVEREQLGFDHGRIGALIAQKWDLPWDLVETIATHHEPDARERGGTLAAILAVADGACKRAGDGLAPPAGQPLTENWGARALSLGEASLTRVLAMVTEILDEERKLYEL